MKNLFKICALSLLMAVMSMCMTSCDSEVCYECTGIIETDGTVTLADLGELCEGADGTAGEVDEVIADYELSGGTCVRK